MDINQIVREVASGEDIEAFEKGQFGRLMGFGKRPAVLVIDMTNEFVDPKYPKASGGSCLEASHSVAKLLVKARTKAIPIIYTKLYEEYIHSSAHGISRKTANASIPSNKTYLANQIFHEVAPTPEDIVIEKGKASAFFGTLLKTILTTLEADTLIVTGTTTSGCVRATVVDGASYGYSIIVPIECCGDRSIISHKVSLMDMHMKYADVLNLNTVMEYLNRSRS